MATTETDRSVLHGEKVCRWGRDHVWFGETSESEGGESKTPPSIMRWMRSESFCVFILCGIIVAAWLTFNFEAFLKYDSCCMSKLRRMLWAGPSVSIYLYINLWAIKNSLRLYLQVRRCWDFNSTLVNLTFTKFKTQALTAMTPKFHLVHNSSFMISTNIKTADSWTQ